MLGWNLLVIAFVPMLLLMLFRIRVRHTPTLRTKPNEEQKEAGVITLGAYRLYTWVVWLQTIWLVVGIAGGHIPMWIWTPTLVVQMLLANAIYWRLGYGWVRLILVLTNVSAVASLTEAYYFLRLELAPAEDARMIRKSN